MRTAELPRFDRANASYERWLANWTRLVAADLQRKHRAMAEGAFPFLRATYFRWAQTLPLACPDAMQAPAVLAVGDLHVENFGTWRDAEGRLVWGVNDFDEAWPLPYTSDLTRLATSAILAVEEERLSHGASDVCEALLEGYRAALEEGGRPFVLAEAYPELREMAVARLKEPSRFWQKLEDMPRARGPLPRRVRKAFRRALPHGALDAHYVHRLSGLGSLGRPRFVAIADWDGGKVAREAKALAPSGAAWAAGIPVRRAEIHYRRMLRTVVRCHDPFIRIGRRWIVRRLAPDCARIELGALEAQRDELRLLRAMGWETANVHLGSSRAKVLLKDLESRSGDWLTSAAQQSLEAVQYDFAAWCDGARKH